MTPQEINTIMATEVMGWELNYFLARKPQAYFNEKDEYQMSYDKWNPFENIEQAFMCLHKWLEDHPDHTFGLDLIPNDNICHAYLIVKPISNSYQGNALLKHEAQAICDCLIKAITI